MKNTIRMLKILPLGLTFSWLLMAAGVAMLWFGYFTGTAWQNTAGLACLGFGYAWTIADMLLRKANRTDAAAQFYVFTVIILPLAALIFSIIYGLCLVIVLAFRAATDSLNTSHVLHGLHFLGILLAMVIFAIPTWVARKSRSSESPATV